MVNFEYKVLPIKEIAVETETVKGKEIVRGLNVEGEKLRLSGRFWNSLFSRYGINNSIFKYYSYNEVFERISEKSSNDRMRLCIDRSKQESPTALAVSATSKPVISHDDLINLLESYEGSGIKYNEGIIESTHTPRIGGDGFSLKGDLFNNQFVMQCPIDGYGLPNIYLSMLRQVCSNGLIAMSRAFRSSLSLGKSDVDVRPAVIRALEGFNNDEGYAALRQRLTSSTESWASVYEANSLYKVLVKLHSSNMIKQKENVEGSVVDQMLANDKVDDKSWFLADNMKNPLFKSFHRLTGDTSLLYGLASLDALSNKRQRTLPTRASVYDLMNFATEVSTHHASVEGARRIGAWVGELVTSEYDLEGTKQKFTDFADFHIAETLKA